MTLPKKYLDNVRELIKKLNSYKIGEPDLDGAYEYLKQAYYLIQAQYWKERNGKSLEARVPFCSNDAYCLPVDKNGLVIPVLPELICGHWYKHDLENTPSGPAAFADPETKLDWYSREEGKIEGTMIKDINWSICKEYRKFEPIEGTVPDLGTF